MRNDRRPLARRSRPHHPVQCRSSPHHLQRRARRLLIFAACVAATLFTLVPHQGLAALLRVSRVLLADDSLHHALSFIHHLSGGVQ
jgi:hypothetical protein